MPSFLPSIGRSPVPLSPAAASVSVWPTRKRLLFVIGSSTLLWYLIVRLAITI